MSNGFIQYPPTPSGSVFTPQIAPYNATQDIFKMYMQDFSMRQQRGAQVLDLMKQLDPVTLLNDELRLEQFDRINNVEKYVTDLMHKRKGRITTDDLFNIQYRISELEKWQNNEQSEIAKIDAEAKLFKPGYHNEDVFYTRVLDKINHNINYPTYLEVNPKNLEEFIINAQIYGADDVREDQQIRYSADGASQSIDKTIYYGPKDQKQALNERTKWFMGQWMNDEALRKGGKNAFMSDKYTTEQERQYYTNKADLMNTSGSTVDDPVLGTKKSIEVVPEYLWAMDYAPKKIQQPRESTVGVKTLPKFMQDAEGGEEGYKPIVLEGDEATFKAYQGVKGGSTEGVGTYAPEKRQSLEPLKTSKNFMLTDQSYIAAYTSELFGKDAKSKIGFADIVGKVGDSHAVSKEGNEILYNQPIYTGEESVTVKSVPMIVNGKKVNKTVVINPGEPITQEVVDAMNNKDPNWEADNVTYEDRAKIVFDFGSKSMIVINPITENLKELFKDFDLYYKPSVAKLKERVEVKEEPKKNTLGKLITPILKTVTGMYGTKKSDWDKYKR